MSPPLPVRQRKPDWFFIAVFAIFSFTSFLIDTAAIRADRHRRDLCSAVRVFYLCSSMRSSKTATGLLLVARMWRPDPFGSRR
jgi:hypothetical protein